MLLLFSLLLVFFYSGSNLFLKMNSKLSINGLKCLACDKFGQKLHRVPKDKLRLKKWLLLLGKEKFLQVKDHVIQNNGKVCGDHFADWAFIGTDKSRLIKFAYPVLKNPPMTFLHSNQQRTCDNIRKVPTFHEPFLPNPFYRPLPSARLITSPKIMTLSQVTSNEQSTGSSIAQPFSSTSKTSATLKIETNQQSTVPKGSPTLQIITNQQSIGTLNALSFPSIPKKTSLPQIMSNQQSTRPLSVSSTYKRSPEWQMVLNQRSEISRLKKKIQKLQNPSFLDKLRDKMTADQYDFFMSQIKQAGRGKEGRRWLKKDVEFALSIYKQSPSAYKILKQRLLLPSKATLKRTLRQNPGSYNSNKPSSPLKKARQPESKQNKIQIIDVKSLL